MRLARTSALLVVCALLPAYGWFYQAGGWNQNSRFALTRSLVEQGTVKIDAHHNATGDKARRAGHFYSDKAPGLSLAAVPVVAVASPARVGLDWSSYAATVATAALPTIASALLVGHLAVLLGAGQGAATFAALAFGLATPAWVWATLFFGHALATFGLLGAFAAALALRDSGSPRRDTLLGVGVGLGAGWAVVTEFPSAPPAALLAVVALYCAGRARWRRVAIALGLTAAACALVLGGYQTIAFGSPLATGYAHVVGWSGMKQGVMGVTSPNLGVLRELLVGEFRGLLPLAPLLALAPLGFVAFVREGRRTAGFVAALLVAYYLLFNAAYTYWSGGWSYGPRHLAPALPFLALGLAPLWDRGRRAPRAVLVLLGLVGALAALVAVSTTAQPPESVRRPVRDLCLPAFLDGDLALNHQAFDEAGADPARLRGGTLRHDAWNLGEQLGLRGLASVAPLAALWATLALVACWWRARATRLSPARPAAR